MDGNTSADGWRYRCPRGHVRLRHLADGRYYCRSCADGDTDPHYEPSDIRDAAAR